MSPQRPDLVDVWAHRIVGGRLEILLLRRAPGRMLAGLWQGVSGSLEPGERVTDGALRELLEETGIGLAEIEAFFHLDQVNHFYVAAIDAILSSAVFAVRVQPQTEPTLSHEHDAMRWLGAAEAINTLIWPAYRTSIECIRDDLLDPERASWFELTLAGQPVRQ